MHDHALEHYQNSGHQLVMDVHDLYVYCFACKDYALNDTKSGDIQRLRETLQVSCVFLLSPPQPPLILSLFSPSLCAVL